MPATHPMGNRLTRTAARRRQHLKVLLYAPMATQPVLMLRQAIRRRLPENADEGGGRVEAVRPDGRWRRSRDVAADKGCRSDATLAGLEGTSDCLLWDLIQGLVRPGPAGRALSTISELIGATESGLRRAHRPQSLTVKHSEQTLRNEQTLFHGLLSFAVHASP